MQIEYTLAYLLKGQTRQEVIASFLMIVVARGQIRARGQVLMGLRYNTIDFYV